MKLLIGLLFAGTAVQAQPVTRLKSPAVYPWKLTKNKAVTGGLVFLAGASKGFNETLTFHWKNFHDKYPHASARWYNPAISWRNKYRHGNPNHGPKYAMSTSVLVMTTDQYHLNNFINRVSWMTAIVIRVGEGKRPFKYYVKDLFYYTFCHQLGFVLTYLPFRYVPKG
jgi:hypothetical protein